MFNQYYQFLIGLWIDNQLIAINKTMEVRVETTLD